MAKAKWLVEGSNLDLVNVIEKGIAEGASDKDAAKVAKAVAELKERFEADQAEPSVMGLLAKASGLVMEVNNLLDQAGGVYQSDIEAAGQPVMEEESAPEVEEAPKKKTKKKKAKEANEAVEDKGPTKKELLAQAKELGIKVSKKLSVEEIAAKIAEAQTE